MLLAEAVRGAVRGEASCCDACNPRDLQGATRDTLNLFAELSERELEVLRLIVDGRGNADMAARLVLNEKTVKGHVSNSLSKLQLADRTQTAVFAQA
jgi:two-component system, NarL family, response regulator LiaR